MSWLRNGARLFSSLDRGSKHRPPYEAYYLYILGIIIGFWIADLSVLSVRPALLPTQPPPMRPARMQRSTYTNVAQYSAIEERNIFNSDGKIAPKLTPDGNEMPLSDQDPVLSNLPIKLEGTLVHSNPKKSVATVTLKTKNETRSAMVDQDLEGMARIVRVERRKLVFRNLNNSRLEYIDIPKDSSVTFGVKDPVTTAGGEDVQRKGDFDFTMRRSDLAKYTADLGSILQQARMVPNLAPGSGGRVDGFRFVSIQPGSVYEKLGFKTMDVIKKVNGEDINSPTKAMELYNALKSESRISLTIERNGREEQMKYDITE